MEYYVIKVIGTEVYYINGDNVLSQRPLDTFGWGTAVKVATRGKGEIVQVRLLSARLSTLNVNPKPNLDVWSRYGLK